MAKAAKSKDAGKTVTVTLVKSPIGFQKVQGKVVQGMGLRKINHSVTLKDTTKSGKIYVLHGTATGTLPFVEDSGATGTVNATITF